MSSWLTKTIISRLRNTSQLNEYLFESGTEVNWCVCQARTFKCIILYILISPRIDACIVSLDSFNFILKWVLTNLLTPMGIWSKRVLPPFQHTQDHQCNMNSCSVLMSESNFHAKRAMLWNIFSCFIEFYSRFSAWHIFIFILFIHINSVQVAFMLYIHTLVGERQSTTCIC